MGLGSAYGCVYSLMVGGFVVTTSVLLNRFGTLTEGERHWQTNGRRGGEMEKQYRSALVNGGVDVERFEE